MILRLTDLRNELTTRLKLTGLSNSQKDLWLNLAQDDLATEMDPDHLIEESTFTTTSGVRKYYINSEFNKILSVIDTTNNWELWPATEDELESADPDRSETGQPYHFAVSGFEYSLDQPSSASVITVVSSSASDTAQKVRINGLVSGQADTELLTLTGTTPVVGLKSFSKIFQVVKDATTTGRVTATSNAGAVTVAVIPANEYAVMTQPLVLFPTPSAVSTIRYRFIRRPRRMVNAEDLPDLPPTYHEIIIVGGVIKGHESSFNFDEATKLRNNVYKPMLERLKMEQGNKRVKRSPVMEGTTPTKSVVFGRLPETLNQ